jgi:hypothetical protein
MVAAPVSKVPFGSGRVVLVVSSDGLGLWADFPKGWVEDRSKRSISPVLVLSVAKRDEPVRAAVDHAGHEAPHAILLAVALRADQRTVGVTRDIADRDKPRHRDLLCGSIVSARTWA